MLADVRGSRNGQDLKGTQLGLRIHVSSVTKSTQLDKSRNPLKVDFHLSTIVNVNKIETSDNHFAICIYLNDALAIDLYFLAIHWKRDDKLKLSCKYLLAFSSFN